ncbi:hypothetical protein [Altererythrobacter sp.]|uniref:hypothetical protein n=1 Tax=Altererythrobacter sp. TaxID=1872480 RepID=UPI001AFF69CD|nr:hypothetical protein [Altererythrobacter sp.]MBO6610081.1 hypothetical protein [Altererythrobacter sp.]MBO6642707.1 hypothetical protein [Altererythrobacter sp.]MBO6708785.1 hypothetical protein [Altererythrobacter sp.]MBO6945107.1 hypothetical protein [Altererythrobacter sp.]
MSKLSLSILMAAVVLIVLAVFFDLPFVRNGSGVILLVGLGYAYTVAKREVQLLNYAVNHRDGEEDEDDELLLAERA